MAAMHTRIDVYFDPACPFAWIASRWLLEVRRFRALELTWYPTSLYLLNEGRDVAASYRSLLDRSPAAARVLAAAARHHGDEVAPALYTAVGDAMFSSDNRDVVHNPRALARRWAEAMRAAIDKALAEVGLPSELAAADSTAHDDALRANQDAATGKVGDAVGTPVLCVDGNGVFGPVLTSIPRGRHAARLFDAVRVLAGHEGFFELKRTLTGRLSFT
jgi:hypothetical protein